MSGIEQNENEALAAAETYLQPPDEPYGGTDVECPECYSEDSESENDDESFYCRTCGHRWQQ